MHYILYYSSIIHSADVIRIINIVRYDSMSPRRRFVSTRRRRLIHIKIINAHDFIVIITITIIIIERFACASDSLRTNNYARGFRRPDDVPAAKYTIVFYTIYYDIIIRWYLCASFNIVSNDDKSVISAAFEWMSVGPETLQLCSWT